MNTPSQPPSDMGHVMAVLTHVADTWFAMTDTGAAASLIGPDRRLELLGALVQLVGRRSHGFREVPGADDLQAEVRDSAIQLRMRSRGRVPFESELVERQLAKLGFSIDRVPGTEGREIVVGWTRERCATVVELPQARLGMARRRRLR